jgi:hypothetical protein
LVRFYPTHQEITLGSYPSNSTQLFVEYIGGHNLYAFEHKKYVPTPFTRSPNVKNSQIECSVWIGNDNYYMNAHDWYAISYDSKPLYPEQFEKAVKYKFDASHMRELRKPYKKLLKYADTMLKLNNEGIEPDEELQKQINFHGTSEDKLKLCADENNIYLAYYYLVRQTQHSRWQGGNGGNSGYKYYVNIGMIKRYLDKHIKLENPQVLVEVEPTVKTSL